MMNPLVSAALSTVANTVTATPALQQNRARAAALVDMGYGWLDTYEEFKGTLFVISVIGAIASGYALKKRRKVPEAAALYSITGLASIAVAWFTRPDFLKSTPPPDPTAPADAPAKSAPVIPALIGWVDKRVDARTAEQPGWEAIAWDRLAQDAGYGTLDPAVQALLTQNSR